MVAHGHVENGVVVLDDGVQFREGQEVTVVVRVMPSGPAIISNERKDALLSLVGIWKTAQPPPDDAVKQLIEQERMKKHG